jgi:hypothetical protein
MPVHPDAQNEEASSILTLFARRTTRLLGTVATSATTGR